MRLGLALKLIYRFCMMLFVGETFRDIRIACLLECGNHFHDKNKEMAISYYNKALKLDSSNYYANVSLGMALVEKKLFREALHFVEKAVLIKKSDMLAITLTVVAHEALGEDEQAQKVLNELMSLFDGDKAAIEAAIYDQLSYVYYKLGMFGKAEHYTKEALKIYPTNPGPHYNLANIYFAQGNTEMARDEYCKVLELATDKRDRTFRKHALESVKIIERKTGTI